MLCPKCGRPLVENAPYCVHCGTLFEGIGTVEAGEIDLQPDELIIMKGKKQPFQKTKKVKIIVGFSIPLTVILLAGILVAVFFPQIQRSVMGESIYYFYKEAQCASSVFSADAISVLRHPSSYAAESVVTASVQNDSDVNQILQPLQILANVVYDQDTGTVQSSAHLQGSGNDILMVEGDYIDGNFLLSSPQADNTLMFPNPFSGRRKVASHKDVGDTYSFSASYQGVYSKILQAVVDADREALLNVLKKVCTSELDKHSSVSTKIWNERNCRTVTFKFTGADLDSVLLTFLEAIKNNASLSVIFEPVISSVVQMLDEDSSSDSYAFLQDYISRHAVMENLVDFLAYTVYYDNKGNIVFRNVDLAYSDAHIAANLATAWASGEVNAVNATFLPNVSEQDKVVSFSLQKAQSGGKMQIDMTFTDVYGFSYNMKIDDMCVQLCSGVPALMGDCTITAKEADGYENFSLRLSVREDNELYKIDVSGNFNETPLFTGTIETTLTTQIPKTDVVLPNDYEDDVAYYLEELYGNFANTFMQYLENKYHF